MIQKILIRILLWPFSLLYGIGIGFRDFLYRSGILKAVKFDIPIISVGNLSVGGAGKSPHIEYLVRTLKDYIHLAILSRGYQRKSKGYHEIQLNHNANVAGDEPMQFKRKFPEVLVTVGESRTFAIPKIISSYPGMQAILLDDAFQHRSIEPGLNILLTEYDRPYFSDWLLPAGRLREGRKAAKRADIIIVSKCPPALSAQDRIRFEEQLEVFKHQKVFFSYYKYGHAYHIFDKKIQIQNLSTFNVLLICAIANTSYLLKHLNNTCNDVKTLEYEDHHYFDKYDLSNLKRRFSEMSGERKVILTTEKDAMRLQLHTKFIRENQLPIFVLPVEVSFHDNDAAEFDGLVKKYLINFTV